MFRRTQTFTSTMYTKCRTELKVMHYGKTNRKADYNLGGVKIVEVSEEKDQDVTFDQQLSFGTNASKVVAAANSMLGLINRHFRHIELV